MIPMEMDFTLHKYKELCQNALHSGYSIMTVAGYLKESAANRLALVIRHDVDRMHQKALRMAQLEHSLGIQTTYYFRQSGFSQSGIIRDIAGMGHEIGFHYETLDKARGDFQLAVKLFCEELGQLRSLARVETICMHGNPLTRWSNRDIWDHYDFKELGLIGEAYLSIRDIQYFSDTGRTWDMSRKVKDMLPRSADWPENNREKVITTDDLTRLLRDRKYPRVYLTVHPERWSHNLWSWVMDGARDTGMNTVKWIFQRFK